MMDRERQDRQIEVREGREGRLVIGILGRKERWALYSRLGRLLISTFYGELPMEVCHATKHRPSDSPDPLSKPGLV
jgi:hypothetical protein